jgi:hypothetical protein
MPAKMGDKIVAVDTHIVMNIAGRSRANPAPPVHGIIDSNCSTNVMIEGNLPPPSAAWLQHSAAYPMAGHRFQIPPTNKGTS